MKKIMMCFLLLGFILGSSLLWCGKAGAGELRYTPYLEINGEYNDNILFTRQDVLDDFLYNVVPALKLFYKTERMNLKSDAAVRFRRYTTETEFDREDYYANLLGNYALTERLSTRARFYFLQYNTLESSVIDLNEPPVVDDDGPDLDDAIEPGIERFYSEAKNYNASAAFNYSLTQLTRLTLGYRYLKRDYDFEGNTDYAVQRFRLAYLRQLESQRDTVGVRVDYDDYTSDVSDANSYAFALIWNHLFSETMSLKNDIGVRYTDRSFNRIDETTRNWTGLADIRFVKVGETTNLQLGFKLDLQSGSAGSISNTPRFYFDFKQALTERYIAQCKGRLYFRRDDIDFDFGDSDVYFDVIPSLKYRLTENFSLTLAYSYTIDHDRDLDENQNKDRNRVWLMLEMEFPGKLQL